MRKKDIQNWSKEKLLHEYKELLKRKKFGIVWENKIEEVAEQCKTFLPVLKDEKEKSFSINKKGINHIFIEGDNYHALSVLNYTHGHKIDVIYIDPPYNTGAKDWKYNNDYVDKNDMYRHSKWLSFMNKRLRLAKRLLSRRGVLVCTVDDNEFTKLGLLLEEIFPSHQITCVTIVHNPAGIQGDNFSYCHEYAYFIYPKGGRYIAPQVREENDSDVRNFRDVTGEESLRGAAANCFYPIYIKKGKIIGFGPVSDKNYHPNINVLKKNGIIEIYPVDPKGIERKWRFARQTVESIKNELQVKYIKNRKVFDIIRSKNIFNYKTVWTDSKYSANNHGTQLLNQIIERGAFSFPKSLYAVMDCIKAASNDNKNAVILDFFAGSGTTGHAVLELNKDGGARQFILCTNNEDNNGSGTKIARDICYPRIKKVMQGYTIKNGEKIKGLGGNLKYFTTEFVNNVKTDNDKRIFTSRCTEMLCLAEATFDELANKKGLFAIYENQKQVTGIIFDEDAISDFKKEVKKHKKPVVIYVFSYDHTYDEEDFEDLENLKVVKPIPEVILNVYRKIYKELFKPRNL